MKTAIFAPDNRVIASGGDDRMSILWDTETKKVLAQFNDHTGTINSCKFNSDGTCLATCSNDRKINIYDLRCRKLFQHYDAHG